MTTRRSKRTAAAALLFLAAAVPSWAAVLVQCPGDVDGDAIPDPIIPAGYPNAGQPNPEYRQDVGCKHLGAGDGFVHMGDGTLQYMFGFSDLTGIPEAEALAAGRLASEWTGPTIVQEEGTEYYLTLTNVGMPMRPDLFDPHSVHYHGFPQTANVFDGLPESGMTINMGASLTYYYQIVDPGTYLYHCHVEATEHMQMGMIGNLYVTPRQNRLPSGTNLNGFIHKTGFKYAYNDGDGSTFYDVEVPIQLVGFDQNFHDQHIAVQPLPFADMRDTFFMINGRGYPDTVNPGPLLPPPPETGLPADHSVQPVSAAITATRGQRILLRMSNVAVTTVNTVSVLGIPMRVVGKDAKLLRAADGTDLSYETTSVTMGGGETFDVILDTAQVAAGTYFLYATNYQYLSNNKDDYGGMMTEIVVNN
ncbi:MAG: multicopper oxidase domain-containing protein [Thermodesulfobacteriota bacterium]